MKNGLWLLEIKIFPPIADKDMFYLAVVRNYSCLWHLFLQSVCFQLWIFCLFVFCLFLLKTTEYNFIQNYQLKKSVFELEDCVTEIKDSLQFL